MKWDNRFNEKIRRNEITDLMENFEENVIKKCKLLVKKK